MKTKKIIRFVLTFFVFLANSSLTATLNMQASKLDSGSQNDAISLMNDNNKVPNDSPPKKMITYWKGGVSYEIDLLHPNLNKFDKKRLEWKEEDEYWDNKVITKRWGTKEFQKKWRLNIDEPIELANNDSDKEQKNISLEKFGKREITLDVLKRSKEPKYKIRSLRFEYLAKRDYSLSAEERIPNQLRKLACENSLKATGCLCLLHTFLGIALISDIALEVFFIAKAVTENADDAQGYTLAAGLWGGFGSLGAAYIVVLIWDPTCRKQIACISREEPRKVVIPERPNKCISLFCCSTKKEEFREDITVYDRYSLCGGLLSWPSCRESSFCSTLCNKIGNCLSKCFAPCISLFKANNVPPLQLRVENKVEDKNTFTIVVGEGGNKENK